MYPDKVTETKEQKLLGAKVEADLYWAFKKIASQRQENMQEAIVHAAMLYIDLKEAEENE